MIVVGRYKMRDGSEAVVVAVVGGVAIGYIHNTPRQVRTWSAENGSFYLGVHESRHDLIEKVTTDSSERR